MTLLELADVSKSYPGTRALAGVDLAVESGEVHAVLGQNGAGKSTLMKVIAGSVTPDSGGMAVAGRPVAFGSPAAAQAAGIAMVYQELSLVPSLSVGENLLLGRPPRTRWGTVDWGALWPAARRWLDRVGLDVDPKQRVDGMGTAERQLVEIAKALSNDVRILVLDEPTSALSDREARRLFGIIRDLVTGGVAVLYVSHRLPEVLEISDRITVLRDGQRVDTLDAGQVDEAALARMLVGRLVESGPADAAGGEAGEEVLLRAQGLERPPRLKPVDLTLRAGEVVTVFGLVGSGRTRLARALFGLEPATGGRLEARGRQVTIASPTDAIASGIGYVGEDRTAGLVPGLSVAANITLASLPALRRATMLDRQRERQLGERYVRELAIKARPDTPVGTLSGGNQQKVVLARWLCSGARVLILDDPTRGIDIGAKEEVFRLVREFAAGGGAVLYLTSEIREARTLGERVLIMAGGRIAATVPPATPEEDIISAAGGVHV
jgi:ribose transport system ATP-binding protein